MSIRDTAPTDREGALEAPEPRLPPPDPDPDPPPQPSVPIPAPYGPGPDLPPRTDPPFQY